jgi:hypothetical protein
MKKTHAPTAPNFESNSGCNQGRQLSRLITQPDYNAVGGAGDIGIPAARRSDGTLPPDEALGKGEPSMLDEAVSLRDINWRETFPFTHLFRAFRIAIHPSKLILALVALGCLWFGGSILDGLWNKNHQVMLPERLELFHGKALKLVSNLNPLTDPEQYLAMQRRIEEVNSRRFGVFQTFFDYEVDKANDVLMFKGGPTAIVDSIWEFIAVGPGWLWSHHWLFAILYTAWFLLIWSVFGGAISRIAAVHVARDEKISVRHALTFSMSKVLSFIFAPVIPVAIVLGIGVVIAIAATILLHIPWVGPIVAGLFFCLALLGGFVITLVILGTIGGFNLMYPTVAVEGSDSFDAISRSFSYVFARPWRMLWYTGISLVYGAICYLFVRFFVWIMLAATWFFMSWFLGQHGAPGEKLQHPADVWPLIWQKPGLGANGTTDPNNELMYRPSYEHLKGTEAVAAGLIVWWNYIVIGLIGAFTISFYFSANSIIYYLMRREVDATELDDVYVEEADDEVEDAGAPAVTAAAKISEKSTVRVYETEEGAPAPSEAAATPPSEPPSGQ